MIRMMSLTLLAEFHGISMILVEILLMVVAVITVSGQPVLISMMHIGLSLVTAIGDGLSDPTSIATSYS